MSLRIVDPAFLGLVSGSLGCGLATQSVPVAADGTQDALLLLPVEQLAAVTQAPPLGRPHDDAPCAVQWKLVSWDAAWFGGARFTVAVDLPHVEVYPIQQVLPGCMGVVVAQSGAFDGLNASVASSLPDLEMRPRRTTVDLVAVGVVAWGAGDHACFEQRGRGRLHCSADETCEVRSVDWQSVRVVGPDEEPRGATFTCAQWWVLPPRP